MAVQKYNEFLSEYQNSINISDEKREEYVKKYGRLTLPTEELGMDAIAKENYLLQYAMTYPKDYVRLRNEEISKIHNEVNEEYIKKIINLQRAQKYLDNVGETE
eukprot:gene7429-11752_t